MRAARIAVLVLAAASAVASAEERARYRASGADVRLFDQYDNDGYSLEVAPGPDGSVTLNVRVSDAPLASAAPFPPYSSRGPSPPAARDRDAFSARLVSGSRTEQEAVRRLLLGIAGEVRYDPDRLRRQDPAAVFASRRAYCVGFADLAVDLLARAGIAARTVQGILRAGPESDGYDPAIGGVYHRWIEVHYPDRGYVFSDPRSSINGVDARYIPFSRRALARPKDLAVTEISLAGSLSYRPARAGDRTVRIRP